LTIPRHFIPGKRPGIFGLRDTETPNSSPLPQPGLYFVLLSPRKSSEVFHYQLKCHSLLGTTVAVSTGSSLPCVGIRPVQLSLVLLLPLFFSSTQPPAETGADCEGL